MHSIHTHTEYQCDQCGTPVNPARYEIGYTTCKPCGQKAALKVRHTIIPMHKSNSIAVSAEAARELIKHLNKRANS